MFASIDKNGSPTLMRRFLSLFMVFVFVFGLSVATPKPALASDEGIIAQLIENIKVGLQQIQWLKDMFDVITKINSVLNDLLGTINDSINTMTQTLLGGQEATLRTEIDALQQLTDNGTKDAMTQSAAAAVVRGTPPPAASDAWHHCASIYENAKPMGLEDFVNKVAASVAKGINLRFRGPGVDGLGARYDALERKTRLGKNTTADPNTYNPVDGNPSGSGIEGKNGVADYDIDAARWDATPLIVPQMMTDGTYVVAAPTGTDEELLEQQRWVAARNFCYEVAGRRPSPPYGKQLDTPDGMRRMANWSHCAAIQSAFVYECARYFMRFSRPNKVDTPALWSATQALCQIAGKEAYGDIANMPTSFDSCYYGLSQYEAEYLTLAICASPKHATAAAGAGANYPEIMTNNDICALRITTWQTHNAVEKTNFLVALAGILELNSCWVGTEGSPIGVKASLDDQQDEAGAKKASAKRSLPAGNHEQSERGYLPVSVAN